MRRSPRRRSRAGLRRHTVEPRDVVLWDEFSGRLEAVERIDVRARVGGAIRATHFVEGDLVEAGDLLVTIDPAPYAAEVQRLGAQVAGAEARVALTAGDWERGRRLDMTVFRPGRAGVHQRCTVPVPGGAAACGLPKEIFRNFCAASGENRSVAPMPLSRAEKPPVQGDATMIRTTILILATAGLLGAANPASAEETAPPRGNQEFIGVDLDNGGVYYNGRNSGRYCLYRTVEVFNRYIGYVEARRVRRCGTGLYLP